MMNMINLLILPIILPFFFAIFLLFFKNQIRTQRVITVIGLVTSLMVAFRLIWKVKTFGVQTVTLGSWPAPFGITLASDMLSSLLVTTSVIITLRVVIYSFSAIGEARERFYYYPTILFMLTGIIGAFTTSDNFKMFIFFYVLLIVSYLLIILWAEKRQVRESIEYLLVNVISSSLFVVSVGLLYSVVGTLNMADISAKISDVGQTGLLTVIAILFLMVFGIK